MSSRFVNLPLLCHATRVVSANADSAAPLSAIVVSGSLEASGRLVLEYQLLGNLQQVLLPATAIGAAHGARRRDQLWRHTCLELFARTADLPGYLEFNFAPNGDWAAYEFDDYRNGQRNLETDHCTVNLQHQSERDLLVRVTLMVPVMASTPRVTSWQLGMAAVIEAHDGKL